MKSTRIALLLLVILTAFKLALSTAHAQNTVFTYQGRITDNGTNFNGSGQFEFALVTSTNASHTATATANAPSGGYITGYNVLLAGNGYVTAPAVTVSGGGGSGAAATAHLTGSTVTSLTVASTGDGNYTSAPTVLIAPPPPAITYTTYWSNDGTSVNGSEPSAAVNVTVNSGLFVVVLGDTTLQNMAAISASLFNQPNFQLRIWFSDGVNNFAALNPAQNLTPTPYADYAANAGTAGSANSVSAANIVGTIPATQLPASVITNGASGVNITGTFSGNGAGVTNVNLSTLNGHGLLSWGNFTLASAPGVGSNPFSVVAADVNGDGKVDLISANYNSAGTLTVLTNNGSGGFGFNASLTVGSAPASVVAADVNGDGKLDLISANSGASTLTVLTNNGSGGFGSNATLNVGSEPNWVVAADVNGDGKLDLISANAGPSTLTVLTNNGSGGFGSNATLNVGSEPFFVVAADVNGDGKVDLISANNGAGTLTVLFNTPMFAGNFTGNFTGNGSGLTALNAASLTTGTVPDARLSSNVALRAGGNTFAGNQIITNGSVLIGTNVPVGANRLVVNGDAALLSNVALGNELASDSYAGSPAVAVMTVNNGIYANGFQLAGSVGINTLYPSYMTRNFSLEVNGSGLFTSGVESDDLIYGTTDIQIDGNAYKPGGGSWTSLSDERLKKNIQPLAGALDKFLALRGVSFEFKDPEKIHELPGERIGMIAQEVEKVFPDWVSTGTDGYRRLTYRGFEALTVEALRELRAEKDAKIAALEKQNAQMEQELAEQKKTSSQMEARLDQMEKAVARNTEKSGARFALDSKAAENK